MSSWLKLPVALFLVAYFLFLVLSNVPAAWGVWLAAKSAPGLWMSTPEGTLWRGKARSAQYDVPGQPPVALGTVTWRLSPWSLVALKPCVDLTASAPSQNISGTVCASVGGTTEAKDFMLDAPIAVLGEYLPLPLSGDFSLQILRGKLMADGTIEDLDARYSWQRARAEFDGNWYNFGSIAGTAVANGQGGVLAKIFELEGPYKVNLEGDWQDLKQGWKVQGQIAPGAGAADIIVQGLQLLGEDLGNGEYQVQWP